MDPLKFIEMQKQIKDNNTELHDFLKDMDSWVAETKKGSMKANKSNQNDLPPVRNSLLKKKKKKRDSCQSDTKKSKRISSYDYKAWDKFDVDKALEEDDHNNGLGSSDGSDAETDEEWEDERRKALANQEKDKGNLRFKEGKYEEAIEHYSMAIRMDPINSVLYSNRAMAQIKMERYAAAENDCTTAIQIDKDFVKAYFRRGTARKNLNRLDDALADFKQVLIIEPHNKLAQKEADELEKEINPTGIVFPIEKPPEKRSKKPLIRIKIQEVGQESLRSATTSKTTTGMTGEDALKLLSSSKPTSSDRGASTQPVNCRGDSGDTSSSDKSTSYCQLPLPKTSLQLQTDIRDLKKRNHLESLVHYVCAIPADNLSRLFAKGLESTEMSAMLQGVLGGLNKAIITPENAFDFLTALSNLPRFGITWMFLSNSERQYAKDVIDTLKSTMSDDKIGVLCKSFS